MEPHKFTPLPQTILNSNDRYSNQKELSSSSISEKIANYNRPSSYTFYQPTHSFSAVTGTINKQYQKKEYHFVSESFSGSRLPGIRPVAHQSLERQNSQNQQKGYGFKIFNSVAKFQTPQIKSKIEIGNYGSNSIVSSAFTVDRDTTDLSKLEVKKISSYEQKNQSVMAQSTIVQQQRKIFEDKPKSKLNQLRGNSSSSSLRQSIIIQSNISLEYLSHSELIKKFEALLIMQKQLEKRNSNLEQQLLCNQSNKRYQQKCQELNQSLQKYIKSQQSLKISRNIISTLNQKIVRTTKQSQANITKLQQKHQIQLVELKLTHEKECKKLQSTIFELKLKVIDQTNAMEQALSRAQQIFRINLDKQYKNYQNQINDLRNIAELNQNQIRRLNQIIIKLQSDIMKLDQHNMKMDQQIANFITQRNFFQEIIRNLRLQNETLAHQLSQTHLFLQDLKVQNIGLKQRQQQVILIKQKNNSIHSTDEEKGFFLSNISNFGVQIKILLEQIQQLKTNITLLKTEKQQLQQQLQQKEGQVAKLNITKGSLMLQNLKFKDKFKKSASHELNTTQHDVQSQEITNLKAEIRQLKEEIQTKKAENKQKVISLSQRQNQLNKLNQLVINREQELQNLKYQQLIQKEKYQFNFKKKQQEWTMHNQDLQKQLYLEKNRNFQINYEAKNHQDVNESILKLKEKNSKLELLLKQPQKSSRQIDQQTLQISNIKQQMTFSQEKQECQKRMQFINGQFRYKINQRSGNYELIKIQLTQTIEKQAKRIDYLQRLIEIIKQQSQSLILKEKKLQSQIDTSQKQKIAELELQLKKSLQIIEQQKFAIEQLNTELQMQEKDYRTMVEEQINKITMIYSEQNNQPDSPLKINLPKVIQEFKFNQNQLEQSSPSQNNQLQTMCKDDLINKIRELQFIKNSLQLKVEQINSMQQNLNDVIIDKLKNFEVNLQKNQQQKHELQQKVFQLTNQLQVMVQKCQQYESKIEWVDNLYKEVQFNLSDTIQELIRTQALYYNLKLQLQNSNQTTLKQNKLQISAQSQFDIKQEEAQESQAKNQGMNGPQVNQDTQIQQQKQVIEEDPLATYQITDQDLEQFQLKYYVRQAKNGDQLYQITISQVDSQQQEQQQKIQKREKMHDNEDDDNDLVWKEEWKQQNELINKKITNSHFGEWNDSYKKQKKQQVPQKPQKVIQQTFWHQENSMSNYIMNTIKKLQSNKNQKIAMQKRQKQEVFRALQQGQFLQIEQIYKQVVQIQQNVNHQ